MIIEEGRNRNFRMSLIAICIFLILQLFVPSVINFYWDFSYYSIDLSLGFYHGLYYTSYYGIDFQFIVLIVVTISLTVTALIPLIALAVKINGFNLKISLALGVISAVSLLLQPILYFFFGNLLYNNGNFYIGFERFYSNIFLTLIVVYGTSLNYKSSEEEDVDIGMGRSRKYRLVLVVLSIIILLYLLAPTSITYGYNDFHGVYIFSMSFIYGITYSSFYGIAFSIINIVIYLPIMIATLILLVLLIASYHDTDKAEFDSSGKKIAILLVLPIIVSNVLAIFLGLGRRFYINFEKVYIFVFFALIIYFGTILNKERYAGAYVDVGMKRTTEVKMMPTASKFCSNCGNALSPVDKFCRQCGKRIA